MNTKLFDEFQVDQLKEIMNIGASHASNALSQMVKQTVGLTIPTAYVDNVENIKKQAKGSDELTKATEVKVFGDIKGLMYFVFSHENEDRLTKLLLGAIENPAERDELEDSVIKEVGNILSGASLTAFSNFLGITLLHSVTKIINEPYNELIDKIVSKIGSKNGLALVFQIDFNIKSEEISTHFLFMIDTIATERLLDALKAKY